MNGVAAERGGSLTFALLLLALSAVPFVVLLMTSFVRISVVLAILRGAFGGASLPPATVTTGLAILLTLFVMLPTAERVLTAMGAGGKDPAAALATGDIAALGNMADQARAPLVAFMERFASARDRATFLSLARRLRPEAERTRVSEQDLLVVAPAFVTSELRRAFEMGFLLFLPFLIVDLVIASLLTALGLVGLAPSGVALPFKLLLFVLADGWHLLLRGLVEGFT